MASKVRRTFLAATGGALILAASLSGCGSSSESTAPTTSTVIDDARCTKNHEAGKLTYLTSYQYVASASIIDVLAASKLGFFKDVCLDVEVKPGDTGTNPQLVSAGKAAFAALGGPSDVMLAADSGAQIVSIATYGNVPAVEYISTADGPIKTIKDFEGKTIGYKGNIDAPLQAMLTDGGVDMEKVKFVSVGYDPSILPQGKVDAIEAYKSNEPKVLEKAGSPVTEWKPEDYGVKGNFNNLITSPDFAEKYPTAVADFLRATLHAYEWMNESEANLTKALGFASDATGAGFDTDLSRLRWQTEVEMITSSQPEGTPVGWESVDQWQPEADLYVKYKILKKAPDVATEFNNSFIEEIYDGTSLIWGK